MRLWPSAVYEWGSTPAERAAVFPCDGLLPDADLAMFRAVDVRAPAPVVFRWLCQLRVAPYSYDRLDNGGRRSPQQLTPGLDKLERGQRIMRIFSLVDFEPGRSLTVVHRGQLFGAIACTYHTEPAGPGGSRLVVKLLTRRGPGGLGREATRLLLPVGDLVMMRRQLLNLAALAERSTSGAETP